jgi:hypothetical protein
VEDELVAQREHEVVELPRRGRRPPPLRS